MKSLISRLSVLTTVLAAFLLTGCHTPENSAENNHATYASSEGTTTSVIPGENVPLHKDKDIQGVWLAPGFNFAGYRAVYVEPTAYAAKVRDNESHERELALADVQNAMVAVLSRTALFSTVTAGSPSGSGKELRISNSIIKFEKGGGGARYWAGIYGAGQPHIRVRGQVYDGTTLVAVYEVERSGEGAGARLIGGFISDEDILGKDIADLAADLADFFRRTAAVQL